MAYRTDDSFVVVVRSDGAGARQVAPTIPIENSFVATLQPVLLDDPQDYVVALHSIEYSSAVGEGIKVNCSLIDYTRQASDTPKTLYRVPVARVGAGGAIVVEQTSTVTIWAPLASERTIYDVAVQLVNDASNVISVLPSATPTVVTLIIKRKELAS